MKIFTLWAQGDKPKLRYYGGFDTWMRSWKFGVLHLHRITDQHFRFSTKPPLMPIRTHRPLSFVCHITIVSFWFTRRDAEYSVRCQVWLAMVTRRIFSCWPMRQSRFWHIWRRLCRSSLMNVSGRFPPKCSFPIQFWRFVEGSLSSIPWQPSLLSSQSLSSTAKQALFQPISPFFKISQEWFDKFPFEDWLSPKFRIWRSYRSSSRKWVDWWLLQLRKRGFSKQVQWLQSLDRV